MGTRRKPVSRQRKTKLREGVSDSGGLTCQNIVWHQLEALCKVQKQLRECGTALRGCFSAHRLTPRSHMRTALPAGMGVVALVLGLPALDHISPETHPKTNVFIFIEISQTES